MAQQINLYQIDQKPRVQAFSSGQGLWLTVAVLGGTALAAGAVNHLTLAEQARAVASQSQLAQWQTRANTKTEGRDDAAELAQLRALDASQRQVLATLTSNTQQRTQGYAELFNALSRQAHPAVWITGLGVSSDGQSMELNGRMLDAGALPDYLRRLNAEPRFKGQPFASLDIKSVEAAGGSSANAGYTEFALRSQPGQAEMLK